jgi:hypothetical protein
MPSRPDTAELRRLRAQATPGQWLFNWTDDIHIDHSEYGKLRVGKPTSVCNGRVIVAAVNAIDPLCSEVESLRARVAELEAAAASPTQTPPRRPLTPAQARLLRQAVADGSVHTSGRQRPGARVLVELGLVEGSGRTLPDGTPSVSEITPTDAGRVWVQTKYGRLG